MSTNKRGNGTGSVRQRTSGTFEATLRLNGRRWYVTGKTRADAERKLRALQEAQHRGELVPNTRVTVSEHLRDWLESGDWKPATRDDYAAIVRLYLEPAWGHLRLQHLDAGRVARTFATWAGEGRSGGRLLNIFRAAHRAFEVASQWGRIGSNPMERLQPPRARRSRPDMRPVGDVMSAIETVEDPRWRALLLLLLGTGVRLGEALALEWPSVDLLAGTVSVTRSASWVAGQRVEVAPKTASGTRAVTLPAFTIEALRRWRVEQAEERLRLGEWSSGALVFTRPAGGPATPAAALWAWRRTLRTADLPPLRLHDLRHLHASLLLDAGHPLPAVSARLGHASTAVTTAIYAHALRGRDFDAARATERAVMRQG